ncbi:hypothetical protein CONCODRAFT_70745 [Conidiobolus coronatus NRRL 28638]|uniref:TM7S3/TM198-like domain-containing protein n=1 Tax=Conidiobolus coronatus (strain ATCC 28846 / CBS 209.66 / NRRL 28638) TaxID=796925 RepID=A0A137P5R9_CONC2|nr:hypothetical protein CONCODRAFT_70745 [Conidiobolus coronatus NRRL 28638]|eukprot:KXN70347.1 hypothetical protein CONCODRAFT_70745 [Conidiobolus coronatus NRRL 28638]
MVLKLEIICCIINAEDEKPPKMLNMHRLGFACVIMIAIEILFDKIEEIRMFQIIWVGICAIFFGLIGGLLCCRFYRFGLGIMGLVIGHTIGEVISQAANLEEKWFQALSWSIGIVFAIISAIFVDIMIVIDTSFVGAQLFMLGVDYIVDKGYSYLVQMSVSMKPIECTPTLWAYKNTQYYKINVKK